ncbi:phosphate:Na+ symporter [Alkalihalobacillus xiaoxiensis]|uniref:Phosphate:Na+ symporter n=1 Tax=Shouchella xiaoxiensis TaxID=766895 RepID=A0ABS2SRD7_9BACI|nr:Na/Pi symporter [Shouchella xiaoxiensis]MBM7838088.1 phosphate:Na+ symporter [Shouchella xiaoxiensis]
MAKELFSLLAVFIALFLFGIYILRAGLIQTGTSKAQALLLKATSSPLKGLIVGIFITALFQSSSVVTVLLVGLVAAGLIQFRQTIGVILGANIGSCFTLELVAFKMTDLAIPLLVVGLVCLAFSKSLLYKIGCVSFGIGCIFLAMNGFESLAAPLSSFPLTHQFFEWTNHHHLTGITVGAIVTTIIQSSTATIGMAMGFIEGQGLTMESGVAIMLGANIGTCLTAYIASIGAGKSARLVAHAHIWLNLLGALLFYPLIAFLAHFVSLLADTASMQLAHASTIYNIVCSLLVLPFAYLFARFVERIAQVKRFK